MDENVINLLEKEDMEKMSYAELCIYLQELNKLEKKISNEE